MNNWHKALPPQVHSAKVAVVREEDGSRVRGQPVRGCRKYSGQTPSVPLRDAPGQGADACVRC